MFLFLAINYSTNYLRNNVLWSTTRSGRPSPLNSIITRCHNFHSASKSANLDHWNQKQDQWLLTCIWKKINDTSKMAQLHFEILILCRQRQSADWYYLLISGHRVPLNTEVSNSPHSCSIQAEGSLCRPVPCATLMLHRCFLTPGLSSSSRFLLPSTGTSDLLLCPLPFLLRGGSEGEGGGRKTQDAVAETPS